MLLCSLGILCAIFALARRLDAKATGGTSSRRGLALRSLQLPSPSPASAGFCLIADATSPANENGCASGNTLAEYASRALDACAQLCLDNSNCAFIQHHESDYCGLLSTCTLSRPASAFQSRPRVYSLGVCSETCGPDSYVTKPQDTVVFDASVGCVEAGTQNADVLLGTVLTFCSEVQVSVGNAILVVKQLLAYPRCLPECTIVEEERVQSCSTLCPTDTFCCASLGMTCIAVGDSCPQCPDCASSTNTGSGQSFQFKTPQATTTCYLYEPPSAPPTPPPPVAPTYATTCTSGLSESEAHAFCHAHNEDASASGECRIRAGACAEGTPAAARRQLLETPQWVASSIDGSCGDACASLGNDLECMNYDKLGNASWISLQDTSVEAANRFAETLGANVCSGPPITITTPTNAAFLGQSNSDDCFFISSASFEHAYDCSNSLAGGRLLCYCEEPEFSAVIHRDVPLPPPLPYAKQLEPACKHSTHTHTHTFNRSLERVCSQAATTLPSLEHSDRPVWMGRRQRKSLHLRHARRGQPGLPRPRLHRARRPEHGHVRALRLAVG